MHREVFTYMTCMSPGNILVLHTQLVDIVRPDLTPKKRCAVKPLIYYHMQSIIDVHIKSIVKKYDSHAIDKNGFAKWLVGHSWFQSTTYDELWYSVIKTSNLQAAKYMRTCSLHPKYTEYRDFLANNNIAFVSFMCKTFVPTTHIIERWIYYSRYEPKASHSLSFFIDYANRNNISYTPLDIQSLIQAAVYKGNLRELSKYMKTTPNIDISSIWTAWKIHKHRHVFKWLIKNGYTLKGDTTMYRRIFSEEEYLIITIMEHDPTLCDILLHYKIYTASELHDTIISIYTRHTNNPHLSVIPTPALFTYISKLAMQSKHATITQK